MAGSPRFKVYRDGEYVACFKYAEDAAVLVAAAGGDIRDGHGLRDIVWKEGAEAFSAGESYDSVAALVNDRVAARRREIAAVAV